MSSDSSPTNQAKLKNITDNIHFIKNQGFEQEDRQYTGTMPMSGLWFFYNHKNNGGKAQFRNFTMNSSIKTNQCSIIALNHDEANVSIKRGEVFSSSIIFEKDFVLKNLPEGHIKEQIIQMIETNRPGKLLSKREINPQIQLLLNNIYKNPFSTKLDYLYAQSKILEIIYLELQNFISIKPMKNDKFKLDAYDIEAIKKAKEILVNNMKNPPSIVELARLVHLNEFKLKCGFKKVFNDTPYNTLLRYKLEYAADILKKSDMNAGEVAIHIGYKSLPSFTRAFIKFHGIKPMELIKSRNYYYCNSKVL